MPVLSNCKVLAVWNGADFSGAPGDFTNRSTCLRRSFTRSSSVWPGGAWLETRRFLRRRSPRGLRNGVRHHSPWPGGAGWRTIERAAGGTASFRIARLCFFASCSCRSFPASTFWALHNLDGIEVFPNVLVLGAFDRSVGLVHGVAKVFFKKRIDAQDRVLVALRHALRSARPASPRRRRP